MLKKLGVGWHTCTCTCTCRRLLYTHTVSKAPFTCINWPPLNWFEKRFSSVHTQSAKPAYMYINHFRHLHVNHLYSYIFLNFKTTSERWFWTGLGSSFQISACTGTCICVYMYVYFVDSCSETYVVQYVVVDKNAGYVHVCWNSQRILHRKLYYSLYVYIGVEC